MAKHLTKSEMTELATKAQAGNQTARDKLIMDNMGLIVTEAKKLCDKSSANMGDMINEGTVGALEAIDTFDAAKGVKWTTHAVYKIRARMLESLMSTAKLVKIGTSEQQRKLFWNLNKEASKHTQETEGGKATPAQLAERIGVSESNVIEMQIRTGSGSEASLTSVVGDNGRTLFDTIDGGSVSPDAYTTDKAMQTWCRGMMVAFAGKLVGHSLTVWEHRIASVSPLTLQETADHAGITRQRAQQIEAELRTRFIKFAKNRS